MARALPEVSATATDKDSCWKEIRDHKRTFSVFYQVEPNRRGVSNLIEQLLHRWERAWGGPGIPHPFRPETWPEAPGQHNRCRRELIGYVLTMLERLGDPHQHSEEQTVATDSWLTTKEAAEKVGVDRTTIYRMVKRGELQSNGLDGRHRRIDPKSIATYLAAARVIPRTEGQVSRRARRHPRT